MILASMNLTGRLLWSMLSDVTGCRKIFKFFAVAGIPCYILLPFAVSMLVSNPSVIPLALFVTSSCGIISMMGGTFAILPAYEATYFGTKYVGPIHGKMMLFMSCASLSGP